MVIDTSALIALLFSEPETAAFVAAIAESPIRHVSTASYLETAIVLTARFGPNVRSKLDRLIEELEIEVVPFSRSQAELGIAAYQRYGKGSGHGAGLNFGDCFTYALAKSNGEPVLFKGNDFGRTDIASAIAEPSR